MRLANSTYHFKRLLFKYGSQEKPDLDWYSSIKGINYLMIYSNLESEITATTNVILTLPETKSLATPVQHELHDSTLFHQQHQKASDLTSGSATNKAIVPGTRTIWEERERESATPGDDGTASSWLVRGRSPSHKYCMCSHAKRGVNHRSHRETLSPPCAMSGQK